MRHSKMAGAGIGLSVLLLSLTGCASGFYRAVPPSRRTGYFRTTTLLNESRPDRKAPVVISRKTDLARYHGNLLVTAAPFWVREIRYIGGSPIS